MDEEVILDKRLGRKLFLELRVSSFSQEEAQLIGLEKTELYSIALKNGPSSDYTCPYGGRFYCESDFLEFFGRVESIKDFERISNKIENSRDKKKKKWIHSLPGGIVASKRLPNSGRLILECNKNLDNFCCDTGFSGEAYSLVFRDDRSLLKTDCRASRHVSDFSFFDLFQIISCRKHFENAAAALSYIAKKGGGDRLARKKRGCAVVWDDFLRQFIEKRGLFEGFYLTY